MFILKQSILNQKSPSPGHSGETDRQRADRMRKIKDIRKEKVRVQRLQKAQENQLNQEPVSREQRKEIQKEKNRMAAQISRDRQKKYLESLEGEIADMKKMLQHQLCRKCKGSLSDHSTSEEEHSAGKIQEERAEAEALSLNILQEEPEVEPLPYLRVAFERSELGFGKYGSFFCVTMLLLAVFCFSNTVGSEGEVMSFGKGRIMQEVDVCPFPVGSMYPPQSQLYLSLPSTFQETQKWPLHSGQPDPFSEQCKNDFWESYLQNARNQLPVPFNKNLVNCNSPSLMRLSSPSHNGVEAEEGNWTFLVSNPTVSHARLTEEGSFQVEQINYLSGVYEMVAEKVVLRKVLGENCIA